MKTLIGMFLIFISIVAFVIFIFGGNFDLKEKIYLLISWTVFLALLMSGVYFIAGEF